MERREQNTFWKVFQFAQQVMQVLKASASMAEFFVEFRALKCHMYSCSRSVLQWLVTVQDVVFGAVCKIRCRQLVQYVAFHVLYCSGWSLYSMLYLAQCVKLVRLGRRVSRRMKLRTRREYRGDKPTRISMDRSSKDERVQRELLQVGPIPLSQKNQS